MTVSEVVAKGNRSCAQEIVDRVAERSTQNRVKLNSDPQFAPICSHGNELESVTSGKLLGLT